MSTRPVYLFDRRREEKRLIAQSRLFDPLTEQLFRTAGVAPGMRVLDLGCGVGDTTMLASRMVGRHGSVLGIDISPEPLEVARRRARAARLDNVRFVEAEAGSPVLDGEQFDAVVGRLVLMYIADPAAVVRAAAGMVRPGGILCFHEVDATFDPCFPPLPLWTRARRRFLATAQAAGVDTRVGLRLPSILSAAGVQQPECTLQAVVRGGPLAPVFAWADVYASIAPLTERFGIASIEEIEPTSLADRLLKEVTSNNGVVISPLLIGAWGRLESQS